MNQYIYKIGFWSGVVAFGFTITFCIVQLLQILKVLHYPWDEILIYSTSLCIVIPFLLEILALHYVTRVEKQFYSHAAIIFSVLYAVFVTANYVVQLATVIPMTLRGASEEIQILIQTPHSLFWNFDAIGYICMGFLGLIVYPIFQNQGFEKFVKLSFLANGLVTPLISIVYFYPNFSETLLLLALPWVITAPLSMIMLSIYFKKRLIDIKSN